MKRGTIIVIVVLLIVALGVGFLWYLGHRSITEQNASLAVKIAQKDADNDGLSDEMEAIWNTDKNNPDTNGDGVSDGAEVLDFKSPTATSTDKTITDANLRLQALVQNAMTKKGSPLINLAPEEITASITFSEKDLQITQTETVASITRFRDEIRRTLQTHLTQVTGQEPELLVDFVGNGNRLSLAAINLEKDKYIAMLKELLAIRVPESAANQYLEMLNILGSVVENINYMSRAESEPLLAIKSAQILPFKKYDFLKALVSVNDYFIARGIHEKISL